MCFAWNIGESDICFIHVLKGINSKRACLLFHWAPTHLESISSVVLSAKPCERQEEMSSRCVLHIHSISWDGAKAPLHFFFFCREKGPFCANIPNWITSTHSWLCQSNTSSPFPFWPSLHQRTHSGSLKGFFLLKTKPLYDGGQRLNTAGSQLYFI